MSVRSTATARLAAFSSRRLKSTHVFQDVSARQSLDHPNLDQQPQRSLPSRKAVLAPRNFSAMRNFRVASKKGGVVIFDTECVSQRSSRFPVFSFHFLRRTVGYFPSTLTVLGRYKTRQHAAARLPQK
jgi:hypothetical protein